MNRSLRNYFILLGVLIGAVVVFSVLFRPHFVDWSPNYNPNEKTPFGIYIIDNEIDNFFSKSVQRYSHTPYEFFQDNDTLQTYNFLFINEFIDETSLDKIKASVEKGSNVLVFGATNFNQIDSLIKTQSIFLGEEKKLQLTTKTLKNKLYPVLKSEDIKVFKSIDIQKHKVLGYLYDDNQKYINFIEVPHGKGKFYLHTIPTVTTNYWLKNTDLQEYTSTILAYLPKENKSVWFSNYFSEDYKQNDYGDLSVIFDHPALAMSWRIILIGFALFLIFRGKRKQRIIPVIEKPKNTTIEFAQTIGNLYFQEKDPSGIVQKKILYFLDAVRNKYYIETQLIDENFIHRLQQKSGQEEVLVRQLVKQINLFETNKFADEKFLIELDKLIEQFWKTK